MKRLVAIALSTIMVLTGCAQSIHEDNKNTESQSQEDISIEKENVSENVALSEEKDIIEDNTETQEDNDIYKEVVSESSLFDEDVPQEFSSLDDPALLEYIEDLTYDELDELLDDSKYIVDSVSAIYVSEEYLEELEYNSKSNIYFGYNLDEIEDSLNGDKYVFSLGDDGSTIVTRFEDYDDTFDQIVKNVAIGTGVILVCVVITVVSGGAGAPAASMIFASAAETAAIMAGSSGVIGGVSAGVITGMETGEMDNALKAAALEGSKSYKWGAISGALCGGGLELATLGAASAGGLSMNEAATIMKETDLPARFVKQISTVSEYEELVAISKAGGLTLQQMATMSRTTKYPLSIIKLMRTTEEGTIYSEEVGLVAKEVGGRMALVRDIDLSYQSELSGKIVTNLERMKQGYAPLDPATGKAYELHHIGQNIDSPLAILTKAEHTGGGNNNILHDVNIADGQGVHSQIPDSVWAAQREEFWMSFAELIMTKR